MLLVAEVIHTKTNQDSKCWGWIFTIQLSFDPVFHTYRNYDRDFKTTMMDKLNLNNVVKNKKRKRRSKIFSNWIEKEKDHVHYLNIALKRLRQ